jgi:hypothetical protein
MSSEPRGFPANLRFCNNSKIIRPRELIPITAL